MPRLPEITSLPEISRLSRLARLLLLVLPVLLLALCLLPAAPRPEAAHAGNDWSRVEWNRPYGDYRLVLTSKLGQPPQAVAAQERAGRQPAIIEQVFELRRNGETLLTLKDHWLDPALTGHEGRLPPPGSDIAGTGQPQLALVGWSGGARCCYTLHLIELGAVPRQLATIPGGDGLPRFQQRDAEPDLEIVLEDAAYVFWRAAYSESAMPRVVLKFDPALGRYRLAANLMRRPVPNALRLEAEANQLRQHEIWTSGETSFLGGPPRGVPPRLFRLMLDLIYAGQYERALAFLDVAWNDAHPESKIAFRRDLLECRLRSSDWWPEIAALNHLKPEPRPSNGCRDPEGF